MRIGLRGALGLVLWGLCFGAIDAVSRVQSGVQSLVAALGALAFLFAASYVWGRWWLSAALAAVVGVLSAATLGLSPVGLVATVGFAALVGWWCRIRPNWPPKAWQALLAILLLVGVSIDLSALMGLRHQAVNAHKPFALAVLYLATPPWEWAVVVTLLVQARHLAVFVRDNYRWQPRSGRQILAGLAVGLGMIVVTALILAVESRGLRVHVRPNNPFVYAPGLRRARLLASGLVVLGVVVLAPLAEEALFRGILFGTLSHRWGYAAGTLSSALVFGLAHLDLSLLVPLALTGLVFNELYRRTHSLWPSTVAHATLNAIAVFSALGAAGLMH